jgi:hypothetical protein
LFSVPVFRRGCAACIHVSGDRVFVATPIAAAGR